MKRYLILSFLTLTTCLTANMAGPTRQEFSSELGLKEIDVEFPSGSCTISGTLTIPEGTAPYRSVILISGKEPFDRDLKTFTFPVFHALAGYLAKECHLAVLRFDQRGIGLSVGKYETATLEELSTDVEAAFKYLSSREDIQKDQIGLLGHAEGASLAAHVAVQTKPAFIISMAGPAIKGSDLYFEKELFKRKMIDSVVSTSRDEAEKESRQVIDLMLAKDEDGLKQQINKMIHSSFSHLTEEQRQMMNIDNLDEFVEQKAKTAAAFAMKPAFQSFLRHDPSADWSKVTTPTLALYAEHDWQVSPSSNQKLLKTALEKAKNPHFKVVCIQEADHVFASVDEPLPGNIINGFNEKFLEELRSWLKEGNL